MVQFYFLSVVISFLGGLALFPDYLSEKFPSFAPLNDLFGKRSAKITIGFLSLIVGIIKLIVRAPFDTVAVAGDLLPAIVGIVIGLALLMDFFKQRVSAPQEVIEKAEQIAVTYRVPLGVLGILTAIAHFLFSSAVIL
jgi:energy-converting hydrogenase Eha subunit C